jgi:uncharacterized protein
LSAALRRLVIDTNVIISANILNTSTSARLLERALRFEILVMCKASYDEVVSRLTKPKFDRYVSLEKRQNQLRNLHDIASWQPDPTPFPGAVRCRDLKDNLFIDLALRSKASMLITGDQDLLVLANELTKYNLQVLPPTEALALLQEV